MPTHNENWDVPWTFDQKNIAMGNSPLPSKPTRKNEMDYSSCATWKSQTTIFMIRKKNKIKNELWGLAFS
jgi:hypothetical protein